MFGMNNHGKNNSCRASHTRAALEKLSEIAMDRQVGIDKVNWGLV
jgi:hypothetical protein